MKKILLFSTAIFVGISIFSCKDDDYETVQSIDKIKIDSVNIASDTMLVNTMQNITTYSTYASTCNGFYGYDYVYKNDLNRDVTAYQYQTNGNCSNHSYVSANSIKFRPQQTGVFTFKFWTGNNTWLTKNIVVVQ